jgi:predicted nucleic acid-binding protein
MKPMPTEVFFDSSVLLYILSRSDPKSLVTAGLLQDSGVISIQVLNEFANVASRKLHLEWNRIEDILAEIREFLDPPLALTVSIYELGLAIAHRYQYHIYDSLLIASALEAGCTTFYSEDMQDGQHIGSLTIRNPFAIL